MKHEVMTMGKSTKSAKNKPEKPWPDFPLFAHGNGQWAKKVRGKLWYFGLWADPAAAEQKWQDVKEDLWAACTPREDTDGLTVKELADSFLTTKLNRANTGSAHGSNRRQSATHCGSPSLIR